MKYIAKYKQDGEMHRLAFSEEDNDGLIKLTIYEFSYAKAVEQAERMISELTLDPDPEIKVLLID